MTIPLIDARALFEPAHTGHDGALDDVRIAATDIGFMALHDTAIDATQVDAVIDAYRRFFLQDEALKAPYDMARSHSNRGWGAAGAEQVDPGANPDFKQVFDSGHELPADDPLSVHTYYAANRWPSTPADFQSIIQQYYEAASRVSLSLLSAVARAIDEPADYFDASFDKPMSLLRGNYYPPRPGNASERDFGIAPHTDYGCLTLLATDGQPGLEVMTRDDRWIPVQADPGTFIINFGEMLQAWTAGRVVATPHRVIGGTAARLSVPLFFNPRHDVNVAPPGGNEVILAGDHLSRRYDETYVHKQNAQKRI